MATSSPATAPVATADDKRRHRHVLQALTGLLLGMFVSMLASTVVSTSLPVIVHDLGGDQAAFTWVVTATLLTTAISTPIWGKLADLFNRKLLIQLAIVIFVLATAAAGFSQDTGTLIAFRAVQGIGAGGLAALSQVIMADIISPRERGRYMGLFGAVMAVATVGGPLLGGFITDTIDWRWNFFIALPFAVAALIIQQRTLHLPPRPKTKARIDYFGIVLLSAAVSLLLIWVTNAGKDYDWWSTETILMVGGALLAAILFVIVELRSKEPLVPLTMFRNRTFTLAVVASISIGIAMFGTSVFLSQYMQLARGATPTEAGLLTIPMIAGLLLASIVIGGLVTRTGHWKPYLIVGGVLLIAGSYLLSTIHYDTNFVLVSVYMFLLGAGVGMTMQNLVLIVQNTANPSEIGVASSGVTFFRSLGGTIGVSVMGAALATSATNLFTDRKDDIVAALMTLGAKGASIGEQLQSGTIPQVSSLPEAIRVIVEDIYAQAIAHSFLIAVPLAVVSLIAIIFLPNKPLTRMTTSERVQASEADLATVTTAEAMETLAPAGAEADDVDAASPSEPADQDPARRR
ncbi:MDR family MFS transporter [Microbacterium kyungheense]|uniref:EmrB/QacA subfamily drug resistance transporter n=1 Tax=Microbacterium kyungheense TaxID=1263636 RepID=A0A543EDS7_9MICO|nr:MDR family MFS transporter [Microbacterium kyungheense]TQM19750.1 EmrB/QacA subfamily drug resistance transporter [Microbacterium kyungheense]